MKLKPFRLERYFAEHEFASPYHLCASDCESMKLGDLLALDPEAAERFSSIHLSYTDTLGSLDLRQAITSLYEQISTDQILVHTGAEEAIFNFMNVLLEPGDHVIVQAPYYQSLGEVAKAIGAEVSEWRGVPSQGWALDLDDLSKALRKNTKLVVVNFPHNPTGYLPKASFLRELSALSDRHGFTVFSDEVYRGLELDPADRLPAFADINERAVSLGVMSKTYGLPGLRIGWIASRDTQLIEELAAFKDYTTICNSAPSEFLATLALQHRAVIVERILGIIRGNLAKLDRFFDAHAELFNWQAPPAGSVAFPELLRGSVAEFCDDLRAKTGVLLLPGTLFGKGYNAFRIGYGRKNMPESLERFEAHMQDFTG